METNSSQSVNVADPESDTVTPAMESLRQLRWSMAQVLYQRAQKAAQIVEHIKSAQRDGNPD